MEIKTKFGVGDRICYSIYLSVTDGKQEGKYRIDQYEYIVDAIIIRHDIIGTDITYRLIGENSRLLYKEVKERNCFKTLKQAQAEADRRNNEVTTQITNG